MKHTKCIICFFALVLSTFFSVYGQTIHVELDKPTILDDQGLLLEYLQKVPTDKFILPQSDTKFVGYLSLTCSFHTPEQAYNYIVVAHKDTADLLYVDWNNNNNFTDDGAPIIFSKAQNELFINFHTSHTDTNMVFTHTLFRIPNLPDSRRKLFTDDQGNLVPFYAKMACPPELLLEKNDSTLKAGEFYFNNMLMLRRGRVKIDDTTYSIGLLDFNQNGAYNDSADIFMINLHGDTLLFHSDATMDFTLNDVFTVGSSNYKIDKSDKYGNWIDLVKTEEPLTSYYLTGIMDQPFVNAQITDSLWRIKATTIMGEDFNLEQYKGSYVLLNFWGEWCKGCVNEIPELIKINDEYGKDGKIKIIGLIRTQNKSKAIKMIDNKKITWPQVLLDAELEKKFKITGFPTNILILPDGKNCMVTSYISPASIKKLLK